MATLPSGLSDSVADDEDLARFLTQSGHFTATLVKAAAFLPSSKDRETSVSRHGPEPREELWRIGLSAAGPRSLHAAAIFKAQVVRDVQLEVLAAEPPPRHAVITGWPWDEADPELQKAKQKELALMIASRANLLRR
jgi:hypothetical protein